MEMEHEQDQRDRSEENSLSTKKNKYPTIEDVIYDSIMEYLGSTFCKEYFYQMEGVLIDEFLNTITKDIDNIDDSVNKDSKTFSSNANIA